MPLGHTIHAYPALGLDLQKILPVFRWKWYPFILCKILAFLCHRVWKCTQNPGWELVQARITGRRWSLQVKKDPSRVFLIIFYANIKISFNLRWSAILSGHVETRQLGRNCGRQDVGTENIKIMKNPCLEIGEKYKSFEKYLSCNWSKICNCLHISVWSGVSNVTISFCRLCSAKRCFQGWGKA